jgi:hypothetical protein
MSSVFKFLGKIAIPFAVISLCILGLGKWYELGAEQAVFPKQIATSLSQISEKQAEALVYQAQALNTMSELSKMQVQATIERDKALTFQANVGIVALTLFGLLAIILTVYIIRMLRKVNAERKAK